MIIGMDFGTTNSGMAVYDGHTVNILPLDPTNRNPRVLRTAMYITKEQGVFIGREAIDRYYEHNLGRVVKTRKVWIGEIELFADEKFYIIDAYAWVDVSEPGRLLLSVKSRLREKDHPGAIIGQHFYALEDLIALYLTVTKVRAEQMLGHELHNVVLGRPVHFSTNPEYDRLAQSRLLQAAFRAGYEKVYLQPEPIAAAYSYETTIDEVQNVLVFDFGGGTLDITVMRLGDPQQRKVLATGGVPIAGDIFDQKLTRAKLPQHFGEGSRYGPRRKAMHTPKWIYDAFSNWQTIIELQTAENKRILQDIARTAQHRHQIEALISLVSSNYGLKMFDMVEQSKRVLSNKRGAEIRLDGVDFKVREFVTRTQFERIIRSDIMTIEAELERTLQASGLDAGQIDAVIRTGGSAQIPAFYQMLCKRFGVSKVQSVDTFSSVTAGLGVIAHGIETGEIEAKAYTPADVVPPPQAKGSRPQVSQARLDLLQKRILMAEGAVGTDVQVEDKVDEVALIYLDSGVGITAVSLPHTYLQQPTPLSRDDLNISGNISHAFLADPDEQLLVLTSKYRFLLTNARQLLDIQELEMPVTDILRVGEQESFCVVASWRQIREQEKLLLVTSLGYARAYPLRVLREAIEAPNPLKFDHPLPGVPVAAFGTQAGQELIILTERARGVRWPVSALPIRGLQAINCGKDDRVVAAALATLDDNLALVTEDGYGRILQPQWLTQPPRPNQKGRVLVSRRTNLAGVANSAAWSITQTRLIPTTIQTLPPQNSTKTVELFKLGNNEAVQSLVWTTS